MTYLMESPKEADRLLLKSDEESSRDQLILTGLKSSMVAVDAGGGMGFVSKIMTEIVGRSGQVVLVDQSEDRLHRAKEYIGNTSNFTTLQSRLEKINLPDETADYVFCRFVFEYLSDPQIVFNELLRITKRGGKLVIGDLDHNCLNHFPLPEKLEKQLQQITQELARMKAFDPYMGRKLYSFFYNAKLQDVRVHMIPHHLIYGEIQTKDSENWLQKLEMVEQLYQQKAIQLNFDPSQFKKDFMSFFRDPGRFSYTPLLLVEAIKN